MSQPQSLAAIFIDRVAEQGDHEAFRTPRVGEGESGWTSLTWRQTDARARDLAGGLLSLGVEREDRVAIASTTRLEWILADLAVLLAGCATTQSASERMNATSEVWVLG
jgi:long-chain acyl-CoA synthetase